jgi:heme/copper-type cytochrome/quinol oxidase subunit 1
MLFAIAFIVTFVNGGLTGLFLGNVVVDLPLSDTMFVVAHFHMVMGVAPILVVFGAIYHWYPKITGRMLDDTLGKIHFWVTFLGAYAIFFPMHYLGLMGVPRRYYEIGGPTSFPTRRTAERLHHDRGASSSARRRWCSCSTWLEQLLPGPAGRRQPVAATTLEWQTPQTPPRTATSARNCRSSIAGPMTTACRARPRISSRRTTDDQGRSRSAPENYTSASIFAPSIGISCSPSGSSSSRSLPAGRMISSISAGNC